MARGATHGARGQGATPGRECLIPRVRNWLVFYARFSPYNFTTASDEGIYYPLQSSLGQGQNVIENLVWVISTFSEITSHIS